MKHWSISGQTIFAPASGAGRAGIAVIRVSGSGAAHAARMLCGSLPQERYATLCALSDPSSGETLDRGLVLYFRGPQSYTGEDVVEFHVHGGRATITAVLGALGRLPDCRLAEPGEFTRRAFLNDKLDLTEIEGLVDLIAAETDAQRRHALAQTSGNLKTLYDTWAGRLKKALAYEEALLDFADEDDEAIATLDTLPEIEAIASEISAHLSGYRRGERLRHGVRVAVVGPPNAGKSSLVNHLVGRDIAIVSCTPGTTRDVLEGHIDLMGYPLTISDTAGLRETTDVIEGEGIKRARFSAEEADIVLQVEDGSRPDAFDQPARYSFDPNKTLLVYTRLDRIETAPTSSQDVLWVSNMTGDGLDILRKALYTRAKACVETEGNAAPNRLRHRESLFSCSQALVRAAETEAGELRCEHLRQAVFQLGRLTGRVSVDDVLEEIFSEFCIGK